MVYYGKNDVGYYTEQARQAKCGMDFTGIMDPQISIQAFLDLEETLKMQKKGIELSV